MNPLPQCPHCQAPLPEPCWNQPELKPCPACRVPVQVEIFPAWFRTAVPGTTGETLVDEAEAGCFFHPQKKAAVPCSSCGRFLCSLCDCEVQGRHLCPTCLEAGATRGKIRNLENKRTLYDSIAMSLAVFPMLIVYPTLLTAPMTLYVTIRYWKAPGSLVRPGKARFLLAGTLALLQMGGWATLFITIHHHS